MRNQSERIPLCLVFNIIYTYIYIYIYIYICIKQHMKKKIERKGDILTSPYNNGNRKEREREREILSYILTDYIANHR